MFGSLVIIKLQLPNLKKMTNYSIHRKVEWRFNRRIYKNEKSPPRRALNFFRTIKKRLRER